MAVESEEELIGWDIIVGLSDVDRIRDRVKDVLLHNAMAQSR